MKFLKKIIDMMIENRQKKAEKMIKEGFYWY